MTVEVTQMSRLKGIKHIMNFRETDTLKLDRVCRMLRPVDGISYHRSCGVGAPYSVSTHPDVSSMEILMNHLSLLAELKADPGTRFRAIVEVERFIQHDIDDLKAAVLTHAFYALAYFQNAQDI
jgi:hypothetical protein